ncbi:MAG TPA: hypothetical protein VEC99_13350 [Clostridia bacterium]|nr:hypothetical protein [Clostridia bacterium]
MDESVDKPEFAWQPLTPRGVAAFARASLGRLFLVQFAVAILAAATLAWFLGTRWFPVVSAAIEQLPAHGEIRSGRLDLPGISVRPLAENRLLSVAIDLSHQGEARNPAHLQVEFGRGDIQLLSLFGALKAPYPRNWVIAFNRIDLEPWWGAWVPPILAIATGGTLTGLLIVWAGLATLYSIWAWLIAFFANRELTLTGSWRLAGAALMPGALFMTGALFSYGVGAMDLVQLLVVCVLHFVIGWTYLVLATLACPKQTVPGSDRANPFTVPAKEAAQAASKTQEKQPENPFHTSHD